MTIDAPALRTFLPAPGFLTMKATIHSETAHIFIKFAVDLPKLPENMLINLICTIGKRKDTFTITKLNQEHIIWELFSDKYIDIGSFTYDILVEVTGESFRDEPVLYGTTEPVKVALPGGRLKYIDPLLLQLPQPTAEQATIIHNYIMAVETARAQA
jgi:hypothetical protein